MNYLKSFVKTNEDALPSGSETVVRLCDRISSSTLLEDRRDAVRALKSLSKKFRLEVGSQALPNLIEVLHSDASDEDVCAYSLETLINLTTVEEDDEGDTMLQSEVAMSFIEKFIESPKNIILVLDMIERYDFSVRWSAIRLLTSLLRGKPTAVQQIILVQPMGISRMMDLLSENREVIRNEALLALIEVTRGNANIQKIVAFENGFEAIFSIMQEEGLCEGGVVVEDSLMLLLYLLKNNTSNQQFFKEGSHIHRLTPFFDIAPESSWSAQKNANLHLMLKVIRTLVSPSNSSNVLSSCQLAMQQCNLLGRLSNLLMATGVPTDVLTEIINTVSELIRGCHDNQIFFASVVTPWEPPRSALVVLLMSMVNAQQPFLLRCAVLYCFQCYLHKNPSGQCEIISTLLPSSLEPQDVSTGQLLCGGLFAQSDAVSNWLAATALSHALHTNEQAKTQLLRVQLATAPGNSPVTLLRQITRIVQQSGQLQTKVGLINFLCSWLNACPVAISHFLDDETAVPYLLSQLTESESEMDFVVHGVCALLLGICIVDNDNSVPVFSKEALIELVVARVGVEHFCDALSNVTQHDVYTKTLQRHQPTADQAGNLFFDYSFVKMFKKLEDTITKTVSNLDDIKKEEEQKAAMKAHDSIITEYKSLIREQDGKVAVLEKECGSLRDQLSGVSKCLEERDSQVQQLKDQYNLVKLTQGDDGAAVKQIEELTKRNEEWRVENSEKQKAIEELENRLKLLEAAAAEPRPPAEESSTPAVESPPTVQQQQEDSVELAKLKEENASLLEENESLKRDAGIKEQSVLEERENCEALRKEQEDLLILLSDQEAKLKEYKGKLIGHGFQDEVSEDDDDDIEEEEEEEQEDDVTTDDVTEEVEEKGVPVGEESPLEKEAES